MEKKYSKKVQETIDKLKSVVLETSKQATKKAIDTSLEKPKWNRISYTVKGSEKIDSFNSVSIVNENSKKLNIKDDAISKLRVANYFKNEADNFSNYKKTIVFDDIYEKNIYINFNFDENNHSLVDVLNIEMLQGSKAKIYITYNSDEKNKYYHNGYINVKAEKDSKLDIVVIQMLNLESENFLGMDIDVNKNAEVNYYGIEFGAYANVTSIHANLLEDHSKALLMPAYLSDFNRKNDFEYTLNFHGKYAIGDIDARGVTKDTSVKVFRGNLVFERYSSKSEGSEKEFSILLDKTVNAHSIPTLFCDEDDVIGAHSANIGKIDQNKLLYLMSRGFSASMAKKLVVSSSIKPILEVIDNEEILNKINEELERRI